MTKEETRAVTFVGILLLLAIVARFVARPKPIMITAGPVDIAALRAAGEALKEGPGRKSKPRKPAVIGRMPAGRAAPPSEPSWRHPRLGPVYIREEAAPSAPPGPLNLNRANVEDVDRLPGVSPTVARRIVARRDSIGRFEKVEDLDPVKGVGPALIGKLRGKVVFR
ncbi:MAG TPA: helix-hairpin-helix domain-containing protein [Longimicrobiales bacterium]